MVKGYRLSERLRILPGGAALIVPEDVLVVADLHLGCEASLERDGLSLPRVQTRKIREYVLGLVDSVSPSRLVVAGDLKHNFSRNLTQEWQDVSRFVQDLSRAVPVEVVRGNHDNFLSLILREFGIPLAGEADVGGVRVAHGHTGVPSDAPTVIGHIHPSVSLRDGVDARTKDRCFLYNESVNMLVLPALSLVASGLDVVENADSDMSSPLLPRNGLSGFVPVSFAGGRPLRFPSVGDLRLARLRGPSSPTIT
ncbi:MAG: metallophosphoesterase [Thermoplasmata archaeon]